MRPRRQPRRPRHWQYTFFDQADGFLNTVRYVEQIRKRLSPATRTTLDEIGSILPGDPAGKETIPDIYWNASGALYAYVYLEAMRMGIDIVGESQLVGYPTQFPSVSMVDWKTGNPNARFRVLKLIHDHFAPGDKLVADARRRGRRAGAGVRHAQGPRAAGGEQAQRQSHRSAEGGMEGRGSLGSRFLRGPAQRGVRRAGHRAGAFRGGCDSREMTIAPPKPAASVRWAVIAVLSLGMIIAYVSRSALAVPLALPEFIRAFHLSITDRGVLNSAFFWTYAVLQIPAGWVVDRYGVKFPYFVGFAIWCLASASTALTRSIPQLIPGAGSAGRGTGGGGSRQLTGGSATTSWSRSAAWLSLSI